MIHHGNLTSEQQQLQPCLWVATEMPTDSHEHNPLLSPPPDLLPFSKLNEAWIAIYFFPEKLLNHFDYILYMGKNENFKRIVKVVFSKIKICPKKDVMQKIHIFLNTNIKCLPKEIIGKWFFSCSFVLLLRKFI